MGLLPAWIEQDVEELELDQTEEIPREFGIDFETGQLTGKMVEGVEAIKVWLYFALRIVRYRYQGMSWEYGSELEELYGKSHSKDYVNLEVNRMVRECALVNKDITGVEVTDINLDGARLKGKVSIETVYGTGELEVTNSGI